MTDFPGRIENSLNQQIGGNEPQANPANLSATAYSALAPPATVTLGKSELEALNVGSKAGTVESIDNFAATPVDYDGQIARDIQDAWFGRILINPGALDFGPVLSTQIRNLEILNNYRRESHDWDSFTNNVGSNVSIVSLPSLPLTLGPLAAQVVQVEVLNQGPPTISGTLDFVFDVISYSIAVSGIRVVLFSYVPNAPVPEILTFETKVLTHIDGSEQRTRLRKAPRQIFEFEVFVDELNERDRLNALLFDWQGRVFGVPQWHEARRLTSAVAASDTTINVDTTYGHFHAEGLAVLWTDYKTFETIEIDSLTASSITVNTPIVSSWATNNTLVMPVHTAHIAPRLSNSRFVTGPGIYKVRFEVLETEYVGDASAWGSYNSKTMVDRPNRVAAQLEEGSLRLAEIFDSLASAPQKASGWDKSKPLMNLGLLSTTPQELWEIRQLFHLLGGRHTSFYLGTGRTDIVPQNDIGDLSTTIDFDYIDYNLFYNDTSPRDRIRIVRTDGTTSEHQITGSSVVVDQTTERINITPSITPALPLAELDRIEFLTLVRLEQDTVRFSHDRPGVARVQARTIGVPA